MNFGLNFCFLLYFLVPNIDAAKFRCDYTYMDQGWYKYYEIPATWQDANLRCRVQGAILASPTTATMKNNMVKYIGSVGIFTGIHSTFSKGKYFTIDGIPLDSFSHYWANLEPNNLNNNESCLALNSFGQLSDENCDDPRPYVCYRENKGPEDISICGTPDPDYSFESLTNKCYKFHKSPRTFERAHFVCAAEGGHLAILNSEEESQVIKDLFARYPANKIPGKFWKDVAFVGFHNWGESADWMTIHGQTLQEAGFSKFSSGEPNNATTGEYCGSVYRNGQFNDLWCDKNFAFICEKKPDDPPICEVDVLDEQTPMIRNMNHK